MKRSAKSESKRKRRAQPQTMRDVFAPVELPADIASFDDLIAFLYWLRRGSVFRECPTENDIKKLIDLTPKARVHLERFQTEVICSSMGAAARRDMFSLFEFTDAVEHRYQALRQSLPLML